MNEIVQSSLVRRLINQLSFGVGKWRKDERPGWEMGNGGDSENGYKLGTDFTAMKILIYVSCVIYVIIG